MFLVLSVVVPFLVYFASRRIVYHFDGEQSSYRWLLILACGLFFISWYLPSPLIHGEDTSFTTHFVGGGLFSGFLWLFFKYSLRLRWRWWVEAFSLFALVSALGNINEMFELFVVEANLAFLPLADTNWDILANSLGALLVYLGYILYDFRHR